MIKIIVAIIVVVLGALFIFASTKPDTFRVQRSMNIQAAPEKIFPHLNDLHNWTAWSPWERIDPAMKRTYSGPASGKNAVYEWEGNNKVGQGRMEIVESVPDSKIVIKLDFIKPFAAHNTAEFTLEPAGDATNVTWAMYGPSPFISKVMQVFISMDAMVGKDFDAGLANLKNLSEEIDNAPDDQSGK
jgi:carbon monoxide dehydrogenase subunit G